MEATADRQAVVQLIQNREEEKKTHGKPPNLYSEDERYLLGVSSLLTQCDNLSKREAGRNMIQLRCQRQL